MKFFIPRILNRLSVLEFFNLYSKVTINNVSFKIPVLHSIGFGNRGDTEPWLNKVFANLLATADPLFIDVGVNLGQTLLKVKSIKPNIEYIGIEPSPTCVNYVNALVKANNIHKTNFICAGLSDKIDIDVLEGFSQEDTRSTMKSGTISGTGKVIKTFIPTITLNQLSDVCNFKDKQIIIKIDVERFEYNVIKGGKQVISTFQPVMVCEVLPDLDKIDYINENAKLYSLLVDLGYSILRINLDETYTKVSSFINKDNWEMCEYIFLPASHHFLKQV